jgi:uncharacterized protein involved in type VI secretion and phage assembly
MSRDRFGGVAVAKVAKLPADDPKKMGRIQVDYTAAPAPGRRSDWASVATMMAGDSRGSWFMPEIHDEVLVAFDRSHPEEVYVVGFLWNGVQKPPVADSSQRVLKSVSGHTITLDDRDQHKKVEIRSSSGHLVVLDDENDTIEIHSAGGASSTSPAGHAVVLDDSGSKVEIVSKNGQKITIDDNQTSVTIVGGQRQMAMANGMVTFS